MRSCGSRRMDRIASPSTRVGTQGRRRLAVSWLAPRTATAWSSVQRRPPGCCRNAPPSIALPTSGARLHHPCTGTQPLPREAGLVRRGNPRGWPPPSRRRCGPRRWPTALGGAENSIKGRVYNDANANGSPDEGETGVAGVTVRLTPLDGSPAVETAHRRGRCVRLRQPAARRL